MRRIVVFRFHRSLPVVRNRLRLLRLFNPDVDVHGLYGGVERDFPGVERSLSGSMQSLYCIRDRDADWKWKNGDLALALWHRDVGRELDFDVLHLVEWDLLLLRPLGEIYGHIPQEGVGLSGLVPVEEAGEHWSWTNDPDKRQEWEKLLSLAREKFGYDGVPQACFFPGACLPRGFLDKLSSLEMPELSNDELRLPLFAQILGFPLFDTGLYHRGRRDEEKFFNHGLQYIETATIREELARRGGRRAFHPYTLVYADLAAGDGWYNLWFSLSRSKLSKLIFKRVLRLKGGR